MVKEESDFSDYLERSRTNSLQSSFNEQDIQKNQKIIINEESDLIAQIYQEFQRQYHDHDPEKRIRDNQITTTNHQIMRKNNKPNLIQKEKSTKKKQNSKQYRQRKKQEYLYLIRQNKIYESKILELQANINILQAKLNECRIQSNPQKLFFEEEVKKDIEVFQKYSKNMQCENALNYFYKMKEKYGPMGSQKIKLLNYYMSEFINHSKSDFQKYILMCSIKKEGLYGQLKSNLDEQIQKIIKLTPEQKRIDAQKLKQLNEHAQHSKSLYQTFYQDYIKILQHMQKVSKFEIEKNNITVKQLVDMILWFCKNQHSSLVQNMRRDWYIMLMDIKKIQSSKLQKI